MLLSKTPRKSRFKIMPVYLMLHVFTGTLDKLLDFDNRDNSLHRTDWKPTVSFIDESQLIEGVVHVHVLFEDDRLHTLVPSVHVSLDVAVEDSPELKKIVYPEIMEKDQDLQRHAELNLKRMLGNPDADKSKDMLTGMAKSKGYRGLSVKNKRG
jgi:hypothetical protein